MRCKRAQRLLAGPVEEAPEEVLEELEGHLSICEGKCSLTCEATRELFSQYEGRQLTMAAFLLLDAHATFCDEEDCLPIAEHIARICSPRVEQDEQVPSIPMLVSTEPARLAATPGRQVN